MKYLKTFETKANYKTAKKSHLLQLPNMSMELEKHDVFFRPAIVPKEYAEAGDIIVYSKEAYEAWTNAESGSTAEEAAYQTLLNSTAYMRPEYFDATAAQKYLPDAIVAVPYSHTGDGTVRAMSLKMMDTSNPENGSIVSDTKTVWGAQVLIAGITAAVIPVMIYPELGEASTLGSATDAIPPSDVYTGLEVPGLDGDYIWWPNAPRSMPCPYRADGSLNRQYLGEYGINSKITDNAVESINGASNTQKIINALDKTYINDTLFNTTITNTEAQTIGGVSTNIYPAAMCCQRYHTVLKPNAITYDSGTDTYTYGDWYLPSAREASYMIVNQGAIGYALSQINTVLPNTVCEHIIDDWHWTSTTWNRKGSAWAVHISLGFPGKSNSFKVRAFSAF